MVERQPLILRRKKTEVDRVLAFWEERMRSVAWQLVVFASVPLPPLLFP